MYVKNYLKVGILVASLGIGTFGGNLYAKEVVVKEIKNVEQTKDYSLNAGLPYIAGSSNWVYEKKVNDAIQTQMNGLLEEAKLRGKQSKEAYIATGGKEEDYRGIAIDMNYEVKYNKGDVISFGIYKTETMASAYDQAYFYNLNLKEQKEIRLQDFFGPDYEAKINTQIKAEMERRVKEEGAVYFEGFKGIKSDQKFYINEKGNCVIVFDEYEIAPGSMGMPSFEITDETQLLKLQPQAHYEVVKCKLEDNLGVNYPKVQGYKDELIEKSMNQSLYNVVNKYQAPGYSNLTLDYKVTRIDDQVLSVLYRGCVDIEGIGTKMIYESINLDMNQKGDEITAQNIVGPTKEAHQALTNLLQGKLKEKGITETTMEGLRLYFKDSRVVFYYMVPDDSKQEIVEVEVPLAELK